MWANSILPLLSKDDDDNGSQVAVVDVKEETVPVNCPLIGNRRKESNSSKFDISNGGNCSERDDSAPLIKDNLERDKPQNKVAPHFKLS